MSISVLLPCMCIRMCSVEQDSLDVGKVCWSGGKKVGGSKGQRGTLKERVEVGR